jgi:hypothetical protein
MILDSSKSPVTIQELLVSTLAQSDALAKLLIDKGIITQQKFLQKISEERATYHRMLNPTQANSSPLSSFVTDSNANPLANL